MLPKLGLNNGQYKQLVKSYVFFAEVTDVVT